MEQIHGVAFESQTFATKAHQAENLPSRGSFPPMQKNRKLLFFYLGLPPRLPGQKTCHGPWTGAQTQELTTLRLSIMPSPPPTSLDLDWHDGPSSPSAPLSASTFALPRAAAKPAAVDATERLSDEGTPPPSRASPQREGAPEWYLVYDKGLEDW